MKTILKKIIIFILTLESKLVLLRFKPKIIAITGSVGKTSTKDAIFTALSKNLKVRKNQKSFNSEIGTPLTILGLDNAWNDPVLWIKNIFLGLFVLFKKNYPDWLILEVGSDRPGDIKKIGKWLKPNIVVITTLPKIPVHVEYFSSPDELIEEDLSIINFLKKDGVLVLNSDDKTVLSAKDRFEGKIYTYGSDLSSTVSFSNENIIYSDSNGFKLPSGISFKIQYAGNSIPVTLNNVLGVQHILPVSAAVAVGLSQNIPFLDMTNSFLDHEPPRGRMNLLKGKNNSMIIDDTYNASPIAMQKAIDVLSEIKTDNKKIAILGDMLEIGQYSASEHKKVGEILAKNKIDLVIGVGIRSQSIKEGALDFGMKEENIFHVKNHEEAIKIITNKIEPGSIILVKGSQSIRLEKVVSELMQDQNNKEKLLVRQDNIWKNI